MASLAARVPQFFRHVDLVVAFLLTLLLAITLWSLQQAADTLLFTLRSLLNIAPFLLTAVLFAAYAKASGLDGQLARVFSGRVAIVIVSASLFGALSPFCSCGVIPIIAALLAAGLPLSGVMAFWLAAPLMSPEMFFLTSAALGWEFAIVRLVTAIGVGLLAGFSTYALQRAGYFQDALRGAAAPSCSCSSKGALSSQTPQWAFWHDAARRQQFINTFSSTAWFLAKWLTVAFVVESLMLRYLPAETIATLLGQQSMWAIPFAVLVGVPAYLNGYAAIPMVSGLMNLGMAPAAGLAFLSAGAVSSIPAAMAVFPLVKLRLFAWYLALALGLALLAGYSYNLLLILRA